MPILIVRLFSVEWYWDIWIQYVIFTFISIWNEFIRRCLYLNSIYFFKIINVAPDIPTVETCVSLKQMKQTNIPDFKKKQIGLDV